jgi:hypothetical protein
VDNDAKAAAESAATRSAMSSALDALKAQLAAMERRVAETEAVLASTKSYLDAAQLQVQLSKTLLGEAKIELPCYGHERLQPLLLR